MSLPEALHEAVGEVNIEFMAPVQVVVVSCRYTQWGFAADVTKTCAKTRLDAAWLAEEGAQPCGSTGQNVGKQKFGRTSLLQQIRMVGVGFVAHAACF